MLFENHRAPHRVQAASRLMAGLPIAEPVVAHVREVDPFLYLPEHASAVRGFGGAQPSPDPRYCLHTPYIEVTPGRAYYRLRITAATASVGELAVRVHAYRVEGDTDAQMAASSKLVLQGLDHDDIDHMVRFNALEGVHYALYAYFTEPSDLTAATITVTIEEISGTAPVRANRGRETPSRFAKADYATSHRLIAAGAPSPQVPLSRAFVAEQWPLPALLAKWPAVFAAEPDPLRQWETIAVLQALDLVGVDAAGAHGLVIDAPSPVLGAELDRHGIDLDMLDRSRADRSEDEHWEARAGAYDFVVSHAMAGAEPTSEARLQVVGDGLGCLRGRGVGLFLMPFWTGTAHDPRPDAAAGYLDRNAVQQIALRLIGQSYSVSQLSFPVSDGGTITSFLLIAHKLA